MTTIVILAILAGLLLASLPLNFADTPVAGEGGGAAAAAGGGDASTGGAATGGENGASGGDDQGGGGEDRGESAPAGQLEDQLSPEQEALRKLDPETAAWLWAKGNEVAEQEQEAARKAAAAGKTKLGTPTGGVDRAHVEKLEARLLALEENRAKADKTALLQNWVSGISTRVASHDLAKGLEEDDVKTLSDLAMGYGGIKSQLDPAKAVQSFVDAAGPLIGKMADKRAESKLATWKRDFLAGKVTAATTLGEGVADAAPERGEEEHKPDDLKTGKTAERAKRKARLQFAGTR